jgi:GntR family transcriptional repressor for pyruvate dehydrogenase complex
LHLVRPQWTLAAMGGSELTRGPGPLTGVLAGRLRARIARGELQPGDRLPGERELAESLGVHRGSLREALRQLELLRLVDTRRGAGTRVLDPQHASFELIGEQLALDPDGRWLRDLLELRELVTSGALRILLEQRRPRSGSPAELARALDAIAAARVPEPAFLEALWGLPASFARAAGNQVLVLLANSVKRFLVSCWDGHPLEPAERRALTSALRRLARALEARDADRAERVSRELGQRLSAQVMARRGAGTRAAQ